MDKLRLAANNLRAVNSRHEALLTWLISNPHRPLKECADELGYTRAWVYAIVKSDMFQALYQETCRQRNEIAVHTVANKLTELAVLSIDKSIEKIESGSATERFLGETTKNALTALGYGPKSESVSGPSKHLHVHVDAQTLIEARERNAALRRGASRAAVLELPPVEQVENPFEPSQDALSMLGLQEEVVPAV